MSDYGDDYSDYGEDWFYVEDEYMAADDLAEHAVASPPPATYGDDDMLPEWDRFDYFNDIEYASDGYDDATFEAHDVKGVKRGVKRKRVVKNSHSKKRMAKDTAGTQAEGALLGPPPIIWRSQTDRDPKPRPLEDDAQSYALLKDWRVKLADTPKWARASPPSPPGVRPPRSGKGKMAFVAPPVSPPYDEVDGMAGDEEDEDEDEEMNIPQEALMAALQRQLAAAGGPLSGMDPQQLLEYAMRMAAGKDAGEDIAGEMADAMLQGEDEEDDADAEENLLSWVAQQRNASKEDAEEVPNSPRNDHDSKRPPTPPSSEANRSLRISEMTTAPASSSTNTPSLKRKAEDQDDGHGEGSTKTVKKRVTKSFSAPTAASHARAAPTKTTRSTRGKRS